MDNMEQDPIPMLEQISLILSRIQDTTDPDAIRADLTRLVQFAAEPRAQGDTVKMRVNRAARRLGMTCDRARKYWYGEAMGIPTHEANRIRIRAEAHLERVARQRKLESEIEALGRQIEELTHADVA